MSSDSKFNIRRAVILRLNLHFATEPIKNQLKPGEVTAIINFFCKFANYYAF